MAETKEYHPKAGVRILTSFVVIALFFTFLTAYTKYIFAKDYTFYIEAPCDPSTQTCFVRDCSDYCPPNGLDTYKAYEIKAFDFQSCTANDCTNVCDNQETSNQCSEIHCDEEAGDSCSHIDS